MLNYQCRLTKRVETDHMCQYEVNRNSWAGWDTNEPIPDPKHPKQGGSQIGDHKLSTSRGVVLAYIPAKVVDSRVG